VVDVELEDGEPQLVVDAWLSDLDNEQIINLSVSAPYFDDTSERSVNDATVTLTDDDGIVYPFNYSSDGDYTASPDSLMIEVGKTYTLRVDWRGSVYQSVSLVRPTAPIDSITYSYDQSGLFGPPDDDAPDSIYYSQFWGTDLPGVGDSYWIRSYKNDTILDNIINTAYDASTNAGSRTDNVVFIFPIRVVGIQPDGDRYDYYQPFDTIRVELWSISQEAFVFWQILETQINNGGLFATPPVNVPTNIEKVSGEGLSALGWFQVSSASSLTRVIDPALTSESIID
jgi:hypothetical protein